MSKRARFFPYAFKEEAVAVEIVGLRIDGRDSWQLIDKNTSEIDLSNLNGWQKAMLTIKASITLDEQDALLHAGEELGNSVSAMLTAVCPSTRMRSSVELISATSPGEWSGTLTLESKDYDNSVDLLVHLVRSSEAGGSAPQRARRLGARLASAKPWKVHLTERSRIPGRSLPIEWCNFRVSTDQRLSCRPESFYFLDLTDGPKLLLNEEINEDVRQVLNSNAKVGRPAAIREILFNLLEQVIWISLATSSFYSVKREGDEFEPELDWQRAVAVRFARELFPDMTDGTGLQRIAECVREPSLTSPLVESLAAAVEKMTSPVNGANKLVQAMGMAE